MLWDGAGAGEIYILFPEALSLSLLTQVRTSRAQKFRLWLGAHTPDSISQGWMRSSWLPGSQILRVSKLKVSQPDALNWWSNSSQRKPEDSKSVHRKQQQEGKPKATRKWQKEFILQKTYRSSFFFSFYCQVIENSGKPCFYNRLTVILWAMHMLENRCIFNFTQYSWEIYKIKIISILPWSAKAPRR